MFLGTIYNFTPNNLHLVCFGLDNDQMTGEVEVDETYIGGKEGKKHTNKKIKNSQGGVGKTPILGIVERGGKVVAKMVKDTILKTLTKEITKNVKEAQNFIRTNTHHIQGLEGCTIME